MVYAYFFFQINVTAGEVDILTVNDEIPHVLFALSQNIAFVLFIIPLIKY